MQDYSITEVNRGFSTALPSFESGQLSIRSFLGQKLSLEPMWKWAVQVSIIPAQQWEQSHNDLMTAIPTFNNLAGNLGSQNFPLLPQIILKEVKAGDYTRL